MFPTFPGFLHLTFTDILDIIFVAAIIYLLLRWIRNTSAANGVIAILFLFLLRAVVSVVGMKMMTAILSTVVDAGVIAIIVIFQPEIRHFLLRFGARTSGSGIFQRLVKRLFSTKDSGIGNESATEILEAVKVFSEQKTGALIVFERSNVLNLIMDTGDRVDARISRRLLQNLFFKNSPLHDGAVIISKDRIAAARCTLPITEKNIAPQYGMRHKAAVGISEETDAVVVVVSEETGHICFVKGGDMTECRNRSELSLLLSQNVIGQDRKQKG